MLLANQIAEFFKQIYLKKDKVNPPDILYVDRDSGQAILDLKIFGKVWS